MPKIVNITIPDAVEPLDTRDFSSEENFLMLKIGSSCILEGRKAVVNLSQVEIYNKIKEGTREEVKQLELDLMVQRELYKKMEAKMYEVFEGQIEQSKKQINSLIEQTNLLKEEIRNYESGNKELIESERKKERERYDLLLLEKDIQNQKNRELFEKQKPNSKSSIEIGDNGENIFESLSETFKDFSGYRIENKAKQGHKGDFHLFFDEFNVLVDCKNYTSSVQKKEIIKIEDDLAKNDNMNFAWMVSLNTNISTHNRFSISHKWINTDAGKKCIIFINNLLEHNPVDKLRQAWVMSSVIARLTKDLKKEDSELDIYREKELVLIKQVKQSQEYTREIRRNMNASLNILKNMDTQIMETLYTLTNEIMNDTFESTNLINEWWNANIEYVNNESKITSTEIWSRFKRENKDFISEKKITIDFFKNEITKIVDSSTYSEKTKKGTIEFVGFKLKGDTKVKKGKNTIIEEDIEFNDVDN
jgi:hypothetical protein